MKYKQVYILAVLVLAIISIVTWQSQTVDANIIAIDKQVNSDNMQLSLLRGPYDLRRG